MSEIAVRTVGLSKEYRLATATRGVIQYKSLRESLTELGKAPARAVRAAFKRDKSKDDNGKAAKFTQFWALKDVSFEVKHGEAIGLIGRNGAGKSTLLKILSRITDPTSGYAEVAGRVGSLLEVGTGFHPELTGRENIYLNGAILGMRRAEIERKFDEIVSFAEVEKFLDTPVKHYSSGMYLRLGFAVAAHLEPEVLMVDEVLAVGDAAFQKKCLGKMDEVAHQGRTVLFVSHNMPTISQLCTKTVVLDAGSVIFEGDSATAINYYVRLGSTDTFSASLDTTEVKNRSGSGAARIVYAELKNESGATTTAFGIGEALTLEVHVVSSVSVPDITLGVDIKTTAGLALMHLRNDSQGIELGGYEAGIRTLFRIRIPGLSFYPDIYVIEPWLGATAVPRMDHLHNLLRITLEATGRFECEKMIFAGRGMVVQDCDWQRLPGVR